MRQIWQLSGIFRLSSKSGSGTAKDLLSGAGSIGLQVPEYDGVYGVCMMFYAVATTSLGSTVIYNIEWINIIRILYYA